MVRTIFQATEVFKAMLTKEYINPSSMGFSNSVAYVSNGVRTILVSGQVGHDGSLLLIAARSPPSRIS